MPENHVNRVQLFNAAKIALPKAVGLFIANKFRRIHSIQPTVVKNGMIPPFVRALQECFLEDFYTDLKI